MKAPSLKIAIHMVPTGQFLPGKLPPKQIPTQNNTQPEILTQGNSQLDHSHTENSSPENSIYYSSHPNDIQHHVCH